MIRHARILIVGTGAMDASGLVSKVVWRGRRGAASRTLEITFIDDDGYRRAMTNLDVTQGARVIFSWKGAELFRGLFVRQERSRRRVLVAKAYDLGIYLSNNFDTFCYTDETASDIFADCCARFGVPTGEIADTGYIIPELPKPKTTAWDVITDALALTYEATGIRYYPICRGETMNLIERRMNILQWVIETDVNLENYNQTKSIERIMTRLILLSAEGFVLAEAENAGLEAKIGMFQHAQRIDDEMNDGQLDQLANSTLAANNAATETLTLRALGQADVISGVGVFVAIRPLEISRTYYVDEDAHTFDRRAHTMSLKLTPATDA